MLKKCLYLLLGFANLQTALTAYSGTREYCPDCSAKFDESVSAAIPHLDYHGGPIIARAHIVEVLWGPNVDPQIKTSMPNFLRDLITSRWVLGLAEYSTKGLPAPTTNQVISQGVFVGQFQITPVHAGSLITDAQLKNELTVQINAGHLPKPLYDSQGRPLSIYVVDFPPGVQISAFGTKSCVGFCAYHNVMSYKGKSLVYAVQPDFGPGSGCDVGCGSKGMLANQQAVHCHELAEAITDPTNNPGWYDSHTGEEIADICENGPEVTVVLHGHTYTVQKLWSNRKKACLAILPIPMAAPTDFHGEVFKTEFASQDESIHKLRWKPSSSEPVIEYRLMQDGVEINTITTALPSYEVTLHNRNPHHKYTYTLVGVTIDGDMSDAAVVVL